MAVSERLREARAAAGLTQQQVADAIGITKAAYSGYETGRREPDALKIKKLARILDVTGDRLLETGFDHENTDTDARKIFRQNLNRYMRMRGIEQARIVSELGITASTVSDWVNGKKYPRVNAMQQLADLLGVRIANLTGAPEVLRHPDLQPIVYTRLPLLGPIAAGEPIRAEAECDFVSVPNNASGRADAALRVEDDSMAPKYLNGDIVMIRYQDDVEDGQIAAVCIDDSITLKHVYHQPNGVYLVSENPKHPPMTFTFEEANTIHILGLAVGYLRWE